MAEQHDQAATTQDAAYCTTASMAGARLTDECLDCGHAVVLHVGTEHCPLCELVDLNQQARAGATHVTVNVSREATDAEKAWVEIQRRHRLGLPRAPYNPEASDA